MAVTFLTNEDKNILDGEIVRLSEEIGDLSTVHIVTEASKEQKNLPIDAEKKITISGDGSLGSTAYIRTGDDLKPSYGFNRSFPFRGVTITKKGSGYNITGMASEISQIYFIGADGDTYIPVPEKVKGKTVRINVFCASESVSGLSTFFQLFDENLTSIAGLWQGFTAPTTQTYAVPDNAKYMRISIYVGAEKPLDYDFDYYISLEDELHAVELTNNTAEFTDIDAPAFDSFPYACTVEYDVPLHDYIQTLNSEHSAVYVTPEEFGAAGDGAADDSDAIAACLESANETGRMVAMTAKYFVTRPIVVSYNGLDITANTIVYRGGDCAVKIAGQQNTIKIHTITSDGVGVSFYTEQRETLNNQLDVNTIQSASHGIVFYRGYAGIYQNTIRFSLIKAGGAGCYGIAVLDSGEGTGVVTENTFYGGQISTCEWAVYKVGGNSKMYSIQVEDEVSGGFLIDGGLNVFAPRSAETQADGAHPFFKFLCSENVHIYLSDFIGLDEIDLSENATISYKSGKTVHEEEVGYIHGPVIANKIHTGVYEVPAVIATETMIWGKHHIFRPHIQCCKIVDSDMLDLRLFGTAPEEGDLVMYQSLMQLPTRFVVDSYDADIYLHPSYCAFGYDSVEIQQSGGHCAKVYDHMDNLIFDGNTYGDGEYCLRVYKDADSLMIYYPGNHQTWNVERFVKSPNDTVLIEKYVVGYDIIEAEPDDWASNFASYYQIDGNNKVAALTAPPTFAPGKYYRENAEELPKYITRENKPDGTPYNLDRLLVEMHVMQRESVTQAVYWDAYSGAVGISGGNATLSANGTATYPMHILCVADGTSGTYDSRTYFAAQGLASTMTGPTNAKASAMMYSPDNHPITKFSSHIYGEEWQKGTVVYIYGRDI